MDGPAAQVLVDDTPAPRPADRRALVEVVLGVELVAARAAEIRAVVDGALTGDPGVLLLRLDSVQRFDAAGVGLLLRLHRQTRQRGVDLVCSCPPRQLVAVLRRTALDRVLTVTA